jgi:hypothetical protein
MNGVSVLSTTEDMFWRPMKRIRGETFSEYDSRFPGRLRSSEVQKVAKKSGVCATVGST